MHLVELGRKISSAQNICQIVCGDGVKGSLINFLSKWWINKNHFLWLMSNLTSFLALFLYKEMVIRDQDCKTEKSYNFFNLFFTRKDKSILENQGDQALHVPEIPMAGLNLFQKQRLSRFQLQQLVCYTVKGTESFCKIITNLKYSVIPIHIDQCTVQQLSHVFV